MRSIAEAGLRGAKLAAANLHAEAKIRRAWSLTVGPSLLRHTVFLRFVQGRLVIGAWDLAMIPSLRIAAEAIWPQLKERLQRFTGLRFTRIELVPTNPPAMDEGDRPVASLPLLPPKPKNAFAEVLTRLQKPHA